MPEETYKVYEEHYAFYRSVGYQIWFADIVSLDSTKTHPESNIYI